MEEEEVPVFTPASFTQRFDYKTGTSQIANSVFADVKSKFSAKEAEQDANPDQHNPTKQRLRKKLHLQTKRGPDAKKAQMEHDMENGDFGRMRNMLMSHQNKGLPKKAMKLPKQLQPFLESMSEAKAMLQQAKESGLLNDPPTSSSSSTSPSSSLLPARPPVEDEEKTRKAARNRKKRENKKKKQQLATSAPQL
jgi:hypothetical protein